MLNNVYHLSSQFSKSIGFDENNLYLSSLQFAEIEGLSDECLTANKKTSPKVPLNTIQKIVFSDHDDKMVIYFLKETGKRKNYAIEGFDPQVKSHFGHSLAEAAGIHSAGGTATKAKDYKPFYFSIIGVVIGTAICAWIGNQPRVGSRSQIYKLMQDLGLSGVCILGGIILLIIFFRMYKLMRQPADQTIYSS